MNIGNELISTIVYTGEISLLLDYGFNSLWLDSPSGAIIFVDKDKAAYSWLLSYYARHRTVPSLDIFQEQFPTSSYKIKENYVPMKELIDLVVDKVASYQVAELITKSIVLHDKGHIDEAINLIKLTAAKLSLDNITSSSAYDVTSPDFDIRSLLDTKLEMGIPFGIDTIDSVLWGFQPGELVTLLGRQKAGKSWQTLYSAYNAWLQGYTVLFFSVEMGEQLLHQRLLSIGSHVSPSRMRRGTLKPGEKSKVEDFQKQLSSGGAKRFVISRKKSLITLDDVQEEIDKYKPHIIYIDGFSFMIDRRTGRMTDDWQANENVAAELKSLAMIENIVVFVNTQVQEKQYSSSKGIEARSIQGGTGLLKASDYVIGLDKEGDILTLSSQRSRFEDFDDVTVEVNFDNMTFSIVSLEEQLQEKGI